jgi:crossover junction endodeoxyribonuclease RuvC
MKVLGIDPGTGRLGWAVLEKTGGKEKLLEYGCVETVAHTALGIRLAKIFTDLNKVIAIHQPNEAAMEELFFSKNITTAISVSHARGVALLATTLAGLPTAGYTPNQIKQAVTGYGKADKKQVQKMVGMILGIKETIKPDDAADAVAVALTHLAMGNLAVRK